MANQKKITKINYKKLIIKTVQEKYPYLLAGVSLVLIFYLITAGFFSSNKQTSIKKTITTTTKMKKEASIRNEKKYIVKAGDYLWRIAEETYGSGYNAYDIAQANKIIDPNLIYPNQELILPTVSPKPPTKGEIVAATTEKRSITGTKYIIKKGDYLWKIALEAYGDGYAWVKIASFNKLTNPNLIHPGNVIILP